MQHTARIFTIENSLCLSGESGKLRLASAREFDIANLDDNIGNAINDGLDGPVRFPGSFVLNMSWNRLLYQHGLQHVRDLVRHPAGERKAILEQRHVLLDPAQKFL